MAKKMGGARRLARRQSSRVVAFREQDVRQLALRLAGELRRPKPGRTFGRLAAVWLGRIRKLRVCPENEERHVRHMAPLLELREGTLTKGVIDELFAGLCVPNGKLSAATVNKLRGTGRLIIRDAQGNNEWHGPNPFELVRRFREPRRVYQTLTLAELRLVLPVLPPDRRRLVKTGALIGLRPGEALGLLKVDVDLERRMLRVRRSHGRNQTKTGREREFPIPDDLLEDLREAMASSPTEYVFPAIDGSRQRADTKLARMLRQALRRAGILVGYRYACPHAGCGHAEIRVTAEKGQDCPTCGYRLRCSAIPKPLRYYDLRHTCATLHREAGCDPLVVKLMLGHALDLTEGTYTHLGEDFQRREINKLKLM